MRSKNSERENCGQGGATGPGVSLPAAGVEAPRSHAEDIRPPLLHVATVDVDEAVAIHGRQVGRVPLPGRHLAGGEAADDRGAAGRGKLRLQLPLAQGRAHFLHKRCDGPAPVPGSGPDG